MNTKIIAVGIIALVVGLGGGYIIGNDGVSVPMSHDMTTSMETMTGSLRNIEGSDFDQAFIDEMIIHHKGAVDMAQMVLQKSQRPELIRLANEIISAQTAEINLMSTWKKEWFQSEMQHSK